MRQATFTTVCTFDPAIDKARMSVGEMLEFISSRDMGKLRIVAGELPVVFTIREIPHTLWENFIERADTDAEKYRRAFMAGVSRVENMVQRDGVRVSNWTGSAMHAHREQQLHILTEDDLALFSPAERQEIGAVAYAHSFLPLRTGSCFQLPHSCLQALRLADFRGVESSPTGQDTSSERQSPQTSAPKSDATATANAQGGQGSD